MRAGYAEKTLSPLTTDTLPSPALGPSQSVFFLQTWEENIKK